LSFSVESSFAFPLNKQLTLETGYNIFGKIDYIKKPNNPYNGDKDKVRVSDSVGRHSFEKT